MVRVTCGVDRGGGVAVTAAGEAAGRRRGAGGYLGGAKTWGYVFVWAPEFGHCLTAA